MNKMSHTNFLKLSQPACFGSKFNILKISKNIRKNAAFKKNRMYFVEVMSHFFSPTASSTQQRPSKLEQ